MDRMLHLSRTPSRTPSGATSQAPEQGTPRHPLDPPPRQPRNLPKLNQRPITRLAVYIAGGADNRELGLGDEVHYDYGDSDDDEDPLHGLVKPAYNTLLDPVTVGVVQLAIGLKHTAALTHDGRVLTWGRNDFGCLGRTARSAREEGTPGYVTNLETRKLDVVQVVATEYATFVLTAEGFVCGWGTFMVYDGVLGFHKALWKGPRPTPKELICREPMLIPELKDITKLAAGSNHVLALSKSGAVYGWGAGNEGELGRRLVQRHREESLTPNAIGLGRGIKDIFTGYSHSFAVNKKFQVYAWGLNTFAQTGLYTEDQGDPDPMHVAQPRHVKDLDGLGVVELSGGLDHTVARTKDGKVLVWGRCDDHQTGPGLSEVATKFLLHDVRNVPRMTTVPVSLPDLKAILVSAGADSCLAVQSDGKVSAWGFADDARTGIETDGSLPAPTQVNLGDLKCSYAGCRGQFAVFAGPAD